MDIENNITELFELSEEELKTLVLSNMLKILIDIDYTSRRGSRQIKLKGHAIKKGWNSLEVKLQWYKEWIKILKENFKKIPGIVSLREDMSVKNVREELFELNKKIENSKKFVILTECICFLPYQNMGCGDIESLKKIKISKKASNEAFGILSEVFDINIQWVKRMQDEVSETIAELGGKWKKIGYVIIGSGLTAMLMALTSGLMTPAIGTFIGGLMGFHGSVAMSAGLALLGGGAIAAGGSGMAGGTVAIVCGGALLGAGGGGAILGALLGLSKEKAILDSAKIEVLLKQYLLEYKKSKDQAICLYEHFRENMFEMFRLKDDIEMGIFNDLKDFMGSGEFFSNLFDCNKIEGTDTKDIKTILEKTLPIYEDSLGRQREAIANCR